MKKLISLLLILSLIMLSTFSLTACRDEASSKDIKEDETTEENVDVKGDDNMEEIALAFVGDLLDDKYDDAYNNYSFSKKMKDSISPEMLKSVMAQLVASVGEYEEIVGSSKSKSGVYDIISVTCKFSNEPMNLNVVFDGDKKIAGFNFSKASESDLSKENSETKLPKNIIEKEVTVGEGKWQLPGTLTLPKGEGKFPVVVLVHGSGPADRDETVLGNKPFRDIAWGLASRGVGVLRYEKRTKHYIKKMTSMDEITVKEETIDDALNAVKLLKDFNGIDSSRIYLLGHSLGGYLVPRIGVLDEDIAGFIILAGLTRPLEDIIIDQYEYIYSLDGNISEEEKVNIDALKDSRERVKNIESYMDSHPRELMGLSASYWKDLKDYKPTEVVKDLNRPILILQGKRDYQVTMDDFNNWKEALSDRSDVAFKTFDKLNHLFIEGEGTPSPDEYKTPGKVSLEVIETIGNWVEKN